MHFFANIIGKKWNVTPLFRQEVVFSLQHFSAPALDLMPYLQARGTRDCNKGIKGLIRSTVAQMAERAPQDPMRRVSKYNPY